MQVPPCIPVYRKNNYPRYALYPIQLFILAYVELQITALVCHVMFINKTKNN